MAQTLDRKIIASEPTPHYEVESDPEETSQGIVPDASGKYDKFATLGASLSLPHVVAHALVASQSVALSSPAAWLAKLSAGDFLDRWRKLPSRVDHTYWSQARLSESTSLGHQILAEAGLETGLSAPSSQALESRVAMLENMVRGLLRERQSLTEESQESGRELGFLGYPQKWIDDSTPLELESGDPPDYTFMHFVEDAED